MRFVSLSLNCMLCVYMTLMRACVCGCVCVWKWHLSFGDGMVEHPSSCTDRDVSGNWFRIRMCFSVSLTFVMRKKSKLHFEHRTANLHWAAATGTSSTCRSTSPRPQIEMAIDKWVYFGRKKLQGPQLPWHVEKYIGWSHGCCHYVPPKAAKD